MLTHHSSVPTASIALAQLLSRVGDVDANIQSALEAIETAAAEQADLVLFSECALTGYDHGGIGIAKAMRFDDPRLSPLQASADRHDMAIVIGMHERTDAGIYVSSLIMRPGCEVMVHRKACLAPPEVKGGVLTGPDILTLFDWRRLKFGVLICADAGREGILERHVEAGCDAVLFSTGGLGRAEDGFSLADLQDPVHRKAWRDVAPTVGIRVESVEWCMDHQIGLACVNQAGYDEALGYFHCGHAMVIDHHGIIRTMIPGTFIFEQLRAQVLVGRLEACRSPAVTEIAT